MASLGEVCKGPACTAKSVCVVRGVPLCLAHYRKMDWQLAALGMKLAQFKGDVLDLLDFDSARAHLGRALAEESELAKRQLRKVKRRPPDADHAPQ